ncbi:MAG: 4'-phosphopantetheinyl transferase superfamily protein [Pseudomonadota bacterium]
MSGVDGLQVVHLLHAQAQTRAGARAAIRLALRTRMAATLGLEIERVEIASVPGSAAQLLVDGLPGAGGMSLAHDGWLSIGACYAHGAVGIDVMQVQDTDDWHAVARDYLGPRVLALLEHTPQSERARAFAQAWTAREAQLKCLGWGLAEWCELPAVGRVQQVTAAPGYVATVCITAT